MKYQAKYFSFFDGTQILTKNVVRFIISVVVRVCTEIVGIETKKNTQKDTKHSLTEF